MLGAQSLGFRALRCSPASVRKTMESAAKDPTSEGSHSIL